ncbi:hypothetical protein EJF36_00320 [Bacillus sp. HMF5848]|uniref:hypothetical protein n=1 Tax=Bacillus sp. HMF5848 TaxID=2495421 RepID=UPI000F771CE7|nr:hypothetical protein [Bacillus sp. HMF5848]RSK25482.1 hypothetical protein EJF36_00320 [Bacillus sp. HMF5848]
MHYNQQYDAMSLSRAGAEMNMEDKYNFCNTYNFYMIGIHMEDGNSYEGILERHDDDNVYLLVPIGDMDDNRFGYGGYGGLGYGGYGGFGGYGYPYRFRRFRRFRFPFFGIRSFFFPFFF